MMLLSITTLLFGLAVIAVLAVVACCAVSARGRRHAEESDTDTAGFKRVA
jgi:hypothetical protein